MLQEQCCCILFCLTTVSGQQSKLGHFLPAVVPHTSEIFLYKITVLNTMSTSPDVFNFDDWEATFAPLGQSTTSSATQNVLPTSIVATPTSEVSSTPLSGEFNLFSSLGKKLVGGGGRQQLWKQPPFVQCCTMQDQAMPRIGGSTKFCIKECKPNGNSCGVQAHANKKFDADKETFYFQESDARAFCTSDLVLPD